MKRFVSKMILCIYDVEEFQSSLYLKSSVQNSFSGRFKITKIFGIFYLSSLPAVCVNNSRAALEMNLTLYLRYGTYCVFSYQLCGIPDITSALVNICYFYQACALVIITFFTFIMSPTVESSLD